MKLFPEMLVVSLASLNLIMTWFVVFRLRQPTTLILWGIKVFITALSPILFCVGLLTAIFGMLLHSFPAIIIGFLSAVLYLFYMLKVTHAPVSSANFDKVFGTDWYKKIPQSRKDFFLPKRYVIRLPVSPEPIFIRDVSFHTIPGSSRQLLCDIWQPPENISRSGLSFIYLHGSAWTVLDKDYGTRIFFRRLASQGHVIMDVAYRLFPETDFMGMVHDAKHAIAWMKENAVRYRVNPDRIVIGGGSAGAHIALLAAYTDQNKQFMPADLEHVNLSVCGAISLYGQADLAACYYHTCQHITSKSALAQKNNGDSAGMPQWMMKKMGKDFHRLGFDKNVEPGILAPMLCGTPDEKPDVYAFFLQLLMCIKIVHQQCSYMASTTYLLR